MQTIPQISDYAAKLTRDNGGGTLSFWSGEKVTGYVVSIFPEVSRVVEGTADTVDIQKFIRDNGALLCQPGHCLGTWKNEGKTWLDVVVVTDGENFARYLGRLFNQIAVWDLWEKCEVKTGGTGEAVGLPLWPVNDRLATAREAFGVSENH